MLNTNELKDFRQKAQKALQELADENGYSLSVTIGGISYTNLDFKFKATCKMKAVNGVNTEQIEFEKNAKLVGLKADDYHKKFKTYSSEYMITQINLKAKKYPIICKNLDNNKLYKFSSEDINQHL